MSSDISDSLSKGGSVARHYEKCSTARKYVRCENAKQFSGKRQAEQEKEQEVVVVERGKFQASLLETLIVGSVECLCGCVKAFKSNEWAQCGPT